MRFLNEWILWIVVIFLVILLIWYTYTQNDCINDKPCPAKVDVDPSDPPIVIKAKIQQMVDNTGSPTVWPLAVIVALATTLPLCYFVLGVNPTIVQLFVGFLFIFVGVYFAFSWAIAHFFQPNLNRIMDSVNLL